MKITGIARFDLLKKIADVSDYKVVLQGEVPLDVLSSDEKKEWERVLKRMYKIAEAATSNNIGYWWTPKKAGYRIR
ncbi:MAG: hypothetical protein ABI325_05880 [Ginsengibacter sp.]